MEEAAQAARHLGDHEERAFFALQLANTYHQFGLLPEAAQYLEAMIEELDRCDIYRPALLHAFAEAARVTEGWQVALGILDRAEATLHDAEADPPEDQTVSATVSQFHRRVRGQIFGTRAQIWTELGVWEVATKCLDREEEIAVELGSLDLRATYVRHRADYLIGQERPGEAERLIDTFLREATAKEQAAHDPPDKTTPDSAHPALDPQNEHLLRGYQDFAILEQARFGEIDPRPAEARLEALAASAHIGRRTAVAFLLQAADSRLRRGDLIAARQDLDRASEWLDVMTGSPHSKGILEAYRSKLLFAEGAGGDALQEQEQRLDQRFDELIQQWAETPIREGSIGFLHLGTRRVLLSELIRLTCANRPGEDGARRAFELLLRAQAMGSNARTRESPALDVEACQSLLETSSSGFLALLISTYRSHVFAIDKAGVVHVEVPLGRDLANRGARINRELSYRSKITTATRRDAHLKTLRALAHDLRETLLPTPIAARIAGWSAITIVGGDQLHHAPIECLSIDVPGKDPAMIGQLLAVDYVASVAELQELRERASISEFTRSLTLVAAPTPTYRSALTGDFPAIPFDDDAARRLARFYGEDGYALLLGDDASRAALLGSHRLHAPILHFVAHGTYDRGRERSAGLVLHGAGSIEDVLFCDEVDQRLAVPELQLVILTACGSARGPDRVGDDRLTHLGGAFLNAGARAVVLTRADLEFQSAMRLMEAFHRHLAAGDSPANALRAARATGDGLDAYYDAEVQVVGAGQVPLLPIRPLQPAVIEEPQKREFYVFFAWFAAGVLLLLGLRVWRATSRVKPT